MSKISQFQIDSVHLNQTRKINSWNPGLKHNQDLPILLVLDGGKNESFPFVVEQVEELIRLELIQPILLVGIENVDRNFDFTTQTAVLNDLKWVSKTGNASNFISFITDELIPNLKSRFKVQNDIGIVGESLGGLLVCNLLINKSNIFQRYISIDPSIWWNNKEFLEPLIRSIKECKNENYKVWISSSKTKAIQSLVQLIDDEIGDKPNLVNSINFHYDNTATHFTIFKFSIRQAIEWAYK